MKVPFVMAPSVNGNDILIKTQKGTLVALVYLAAGPQGALTMKRRAEAVFAAITNLHGSCSWCEGVREDGEKCACTA